MVLRYCHYVDLENGGVDRSTARFFRPKPRYPVKRKTDLLDTALRHRVKAVGKHSGGQVASHFEQFIRDLFATGGVSLENGLYVDPDGEIDGIAVVGSTVLLVEVKSHEVRTQSRDQARAGSLAGLVVDLGESLLEGAAQCYRAEAWARRTARLTLYDRSASHEEIRRGRVPPTWETSLPEQPRFLRAVVSGDMPTPFHQPQVARNVLQGFLTHNFHPTMPNSPDGKRLIALKHATDALRTSVTDLMPHYGDRLTNVLHSTLFLSFDMVDRLTTLGSLTDALWQMVALQVTDLSFVSTLNMVRRLQSSASNRGTPTSDALDTP